MKTVSKKLLSLLLVAFLLVSALPFQAFAEENQNPEEIVDPNGGLVPNNEDPLVLPGKLGADSHNENHTMGAATAVGDGTHVSSCQVCEYVSAPEACQYFLDTNNEHLCRTCHFNLGADHVLSDVSGSASAPTCLTEGKEADQICTLCGQTFSGSVLPRLEHVDDDDDGVCDVCGTVFAPQNKNVVFHINGGKFAAPNADLESVTKTWATGSSSYAYPAVDTTGAMFLGWFDAPVGGTKFDTTNPYDGKTTELWAHWQTTTYPISIYRIINKNASTAKLLRTVDANKGAVLYKLVEDLGYLGYTEPGYMVAYGNGAEYPIMKFDGASFVSLGGGDFVNGGFNVYLNMVPCTYNLTLNADGGIVTPSTITGVAYKSTVTLPTPQKEGSVFDGWMDVKGVKHPAGAMVYDFMEDTTFTAMWKGELTVMLKVYINGDTTSAPRIYPLSQLVKDSKVFRSDVEGIINRDYMAYGGNMVVYGLYSDKTWNGTISVAGNPFVEVSKENGVNYIYVMLMNAALKNTVVTGPSNGAYWVSNGNGTGYWVTPNFGTNTPYIYSNGLNGAYWVSTGNTGYWVYPGNIILNGSTNPKTGDTAMIEVAAAVMILAAAALVVSLGMRKRKVQ